MSRIALTATLTAADGEHAELESALRDLVEAADEEDGLEVYSIFRTVEEPARYQVVEIYRDQAALDAHGRGDRMRAAMSAVGGLLGGRPVITMLEPIASKGLAV